MIIVKPSATFRWMTPNILEEIESAGRVAYKSEHKITAESAEPFVRGLIKMGHDSVLEHGIMAYHLVCDRGVSHELVRHRIGVAFTQESTRYVDSSKNGMEVIRPLGIPAGQYPCGEWIEAMRVAEKAYRELRAADLAPQIARSVLPTCLKTEIRVTANIREWRHILKMRWQNQKAHPQMRELMEMVALDAVQRCPCLFDDIIPAGGGA
jgi:thymidylate synthase (FAD)